MSRMNREWVVVAALLIFGAASYFVYQNFFAERSLCKTLVRTGSLEELSHAIFSDDAYKDYRKDGTHELVEDTSNGTYRCTLEVNDGRVVSVKYQIPLRR